MLTGNDVLKDFDKRIKLSSFKNSEALKENPKFEETVRTILKLKNISFDKCFLNTTTKRSRLDIAKEIMSCDYVWFDMNEVVAFWEHETKTLHF